MARGVLGANGARVLYQGQYRAVEAPDLALARVTVLPQAAMVRSAYFLMSRL